MNILTAFEKVKPYLTEQIIKQVSEKLAGDPNCNEVTVKGFGLYHVKNVKNLEAVLRRRIGTAGNETVRRATAQSQTFVAKSLQTGTQDAIWDAYLVVDEKYRGFLINFYPPAKFFASRWINFSAGSSVSV